MIWKQVHRSPSQVTIIVKEFLQQWVATRASKEIAPQNVSPFVQATWTPPIFGTTKIKVGAVTFTASNSTGIDGSTRTQRKLFDNRCSSTSKYTGCYYG
ncbi:hypothetical protein DsansV1_C11g0113431 [Dioscorea sansibarensis]